MAKTGEPPKDQLNRGKVGGIILPGRPPVPGRIEKIVIMCILLASAVLKTTSGRIYRFALYGYNAPGHTGIVRRGKGQVCDREGYRF